MSGAVGPIFVIGAPRSGTSIFAWCLGQHPNIVNLPETNWLARLGEYVEDLYRLGTINGKHSHLSATGLQKDAFYKHVGDSVKWLINATNPALIGVTIPQAGTEFLRRRSKNDPKSRWVDATPQNTISVFPLSRLFPNAQFIHLLRNPNEVVRSLRRFSRAGGRSYGRRSGYRLWLRMTQAACKAERALGPNRIIRIRYEQLIAEPDHVLRGVLDFLGESYCEDCKRPLGSKINSSQVDLEPLPRKLAIGRKAEVYYREINVIAAPTGVDEQAAYNGMEAEFNRYCRYLHAPIPEHVRRSVARQLSIWRSIAWVSNLKMPTGG